MPFRSPALPCAFLAAWLSAPSPASPAESGLPRAAPAAPPRWSQAPEADAAGLLWLEPVPGPRTGADNILFLQGALGRLEDRLLPTRLFEREGPMQRLASIGYRSARLLWLDLVPASFLPLLQHEVFGHGYRAREAGFEDIRYELNPPPPYGRGDGSTSWAYPSGFRNTPDLDLAMSGAGIEAADVLAARLRGRWLLDADVDYHEAWLYLGSALGLASYVSVTDEGETDPGNDVVAWLAGIDAKAGRGPADGKRMDLDRLESGSQLAFADPCLWIAAWTGLRWLWNGSSRWSYPMIPLGPARWLPLLGYRLTPFGDQWVVENLVAVGGRAIQARFARGDGPSGSTWGADLEAGHALAWRGFTLDAGASLWSQPPLWLDGSREPPGGGATLGAGFRADLVFPALSASLPLRLGAGFAAKQAGYVPGEPLDGGITLRAGVGLFR